MLKCHYKTKIIYITHCAFVIESHKSNSRNARILSKGKSDTYINVPVHYRRVKITTGLHNYVNYDQMPTIESHFELDFPRTEVSYPLHLIYYLWYTI